MLTHILAASEHMIFRMNNSGKIVAKVKFAIDVYLINLLCENYLTTVS